jgi:HD superfamily phosphohydrolase
MNDYKVINDPVFGFIKVPRGLLLDIVKHRLFQRLSRIKQLGMASVVYPGAQHTRFQHSLGAFHLMSEAILSLQQKGIFIFDSEAEALKAAILLHDVGHGPFSHVLEHTLISGISHEQISLMMMEEMNREMQGRLTLAIKIFKDDYPKRFLHQLISSQLDMDRLDYLRRDSFFTGVTEGNIGSARIIKMLNVVDDRLVVEQKGIYSIENYLTSRRLMYWQVYLHKTTVAYEKMLVCLLRRAKYLAQRGDEVFATPALRFFLYNNVTAEHFDADPQSLANYELLDDNDIWASVKTWMSHPDRVLSLLATDLAERKIFRVEVSREPFADADVQALQQQLADAFGVSFDDAAYLMSVNTIQKDMYDPSEDQIDILQTSHQPFQPGQEQEETELEEKHLVDIAEASELFNISLLSKKIRKYYLCYQRI